MYHNGIKRTAKRLQRALFGVLLVAMAVAVAPGVSQAQVVPERLATQDLSRQYMRAQTAYRSGSSLREAKARIDRVLREAPDHTESLLLRAKVLLQMKRFAEAQRDAEAVVRQDPVHFEAHVLLCEAVREQGDTVEARRLLHVAAALVAEDAPLHLRLSWNALELDELEHAAAFARIALQQDESLPLAYYQLARIFLRQQRTEEAAMILARGFELEVLDASTLARDPTLAPLQTHRKITPYLR